MGSRVSSVLGSLVMAGAETVRVPVAKSPVTVRRCEVCVPVAKSPVTRGVLVARIVVAKSPWT